MIEMQKIREKKRLELESKVTKDQTIITKYFLAYN